MSAAVQNARIRRLAAVVGVSVALLSAAPIAATHADTVGSILSPTEDPDSAGTPTSVAGQPTEPTDSSETPAAPSSEPTTPVLAPQTNDPVDAEPNADDDAQSPANETAIPTKEPVATAPRASSTSTGTQPRTPKVQSTAPTPKPQHCRLSDERLGTAGHCSTTPNEVPLRPPLEKDPDGTIVEQHPVDEPASSRPVADATTFLAEAEPLAVSPSSGVSSPLGDGPANLFLMMNQIIAAAAAFPRNIGLALGMPNRGASSGIAARLQAMTTSVATQHIPLDAQAREVVFSPDGTVRYVILDGPGPYVYAIDAATGEQQQWALPDGLFPQHSAVSPDGSKLYVTAQVAMMSSDTNGSLVVFDTNTGTVLATVPATYAPLKVAVTPDGRTIVIADYYANTAGDPYLLLIDSETYSIVKVIAAPRDDFMSGPMVLSPDGKVAYLSNGVRVDLETGTITLGPPGAAPIGFSNDGSLLAWEYHGSQISIITIDTETGSVLSRAPYGHSNLYAYALSPAGDRIYVATHDEYGDEAWVYVYDTQSNTFLGRALIAKSDTGHGFTTASMSGSILTLGYSDANGHELLLLPVDSLTLQALPDDWPAPDTVNPGIPNSTWTIPGVPWLALPNLPDFPSLPILSSIGIPNPPKQPDGQNNRGEVDFENNWEKFNLYTGWIPLWGTVINGVSLGVDVGQFINAAGRGDTDDMVDEVGDITSDAIGMVPVGGGILRTVTRDYVGEFVGNGIGAIRWPW